MPTVTKFPTGNSGGWTNPTYAYAADTSYATAAPSNGATTTCYYYGFNFGLPTNATINSVTIEVKWRVSTTSSVATLSVGAYMSTTLRGSTYSNTAEPTTLTVNTTSTTGSWTATELNNNTSTGFRIGVSAYRNSILNSFTAYLDYVKVTVDYSVPAPIITVVSGTRTTISSVSGVNNSVITFKSDQDLVQWEARADGNGQGQGDLVDSGNTLAANTNATVTVDNTELRWGDKSYRINIYGKNAAGVWTVYG